ncbi:hypothetical protein CHUAL_009771 [Chamberlinius hualienensis]
MPSLHPVLLTLAKLAAPLRLVPPVSWSQLRHPGRGPKEDEVTPLLMMNSITVTESLHSDGAQGRFLNHDIHHTIYSEEHARIEAWLDEHPDFTQDYFIRKASRQLVDSWLISHAIPPSMWLDTGMGGSPSRSGSGTATPVRKVSAHEFERGGLLKPIITNIDGTPTFLSPINYAENGLCVPRVHRKSRTELKALNERELMSELVQDICDELDVRTLCHKILQNVSILTNADRCSLFLVHGEKGTESCHLASSLFDVSCDSTIQQMQMMEEVRVPWGSGIAGYVAESGEVVNIPDAYGDARFNHEIDQMTGYRTKSILCMPIKDSYGEVLGVAQVINKMVDKEAQAFDANDIKVFGIYLKFCGIGIRNAQLYERSQLENKRNQVLLDLARMVFEEQSTIEQVVNRIMLHIQSLLQCVRCQVMLLHSFSKNTFSRVFDLDVNDLVKGNNVEKNGPTEGRFPINISITGHVTTTGETLNIPDVTKDYRFDSSMDAGNRFKTKSILCMPIKNANGHIIGVIQLINKVGGGFYTKNDEHFLEAFAIFCGLGLQNTHMYETAVKAVAKQRVTLEVLSYHATASIEDAVVLKNKKVLSAQAYGLYDFRFNDSVWDDDNTLSACLRMFKDLDLIERCHINYEVLCRWLLSVRKNYRQVTYHNWRHAFNVAQMMFSIITVTQWWRILGDIECLSLIVACLCHDLDHRGTNNTFQIKASSPLAQLYSTSTMEHHHFDQCIMILNTQGNQILGHLSPKEYTHVVKVLEDAILATDLAVYFRRRGLFFDLVNSKCYDWRRDDSRELLRGMLMTLCDIAAIAKPWEIQKKVAELVASEFFEQGDIEKQELKITPIDMMDRDKKDQLPSMQVNFIDSICLPLYEAFARLSPKLTPLLEGVQANRQNWQTLAEERNGRKEGEN